MSYLVDLTRGTFWDRLVALVTSIVAARLAARVLCPISAIAFKWIVIGRYKPGVYQMSVYPGLKASDSDPLSRWSGYYLRWWIVNQSLR